MHWKVEVNDQQFFFQLSDFSEEKDFYIEQISTNRKKIKIRYLKPLNQFFFVEEKDGMSIIKPIKNSKNENISVYPGIIQSQNRISKSHHHHQDVKSPMTGIIVDICVQSGQMVQKGECLFRIEAMKMENPIFSQKSGIFSFHGEISIGSKISVGDLLGVINA